MTDLDLSLAQSTTLTDSIVERVIAYIADNKLKPDDTLPSERQLAEALGVSRLPLREALSRLKALGVIVVRQGRVATVGNANASSLFRQLSPILRSQGSLNITDMIEVRLSLEPSVAGLAATRRTDDDLSGLDLALRRMTDALEDRSEFIRCDMEFHQILVKATRNPALDALVSTVHDIISAIQWSYPDDIQARRKSLAYHTRIYQAIADRDPESAAQATDAHIRDIASKTGEEA